MEQEHKSPAYLNDLLYYLEIRMSSLGSYASLVWNRFNWLLTIHLGAIGIYLTEFKGFSESTHVNLGLSIIGILVAVLWVFIGAKDFFSLKKHTEIRDEIEKIISDGFVSSNPELFAIFKRVSNPGATRFKFKQTWALIVFPLILLSLWVALALYSTFTIKI